MQIVKSTYLAPLNETTARMEDAKQAIMSRLRRALEQKTPMPYPDAVDMSAVFEAQNDYADVLFAENLQKQGGIFFYCDDAEAMAGQLAQLAQQKGWKSLCCWDETLLEIFDICQVSAVKNAYPTMESVGITTCHGLIARTGTVLMSNHQAGGRVLSLLPSVHIVIASTKQLFYDLGDALNKISTQLPAMLGLITGPSRTADIEKTLVLGAHAPKELYVFLLEN